MNYSDKHKVIWLIPERTASRATFELMKLLDFSNTHLHEIAMPREKGKDDYDLYVNIRNPYSRMTSLHSHWHFFEGHHTKDLNYKEWLEFVFSDPINNPTSDFFQGKPNKNYWHTRCYDALKAMPMGPKYYVRYEFLETDLKSLPIVKDNIDKLSEVFNKYIKVNKFKSNRPSWKTYYDQEIADYVYEKLEKDFKLFNYHKDSWKEDFK